MKINRNPQIHGSFVYIKILKHPGVMRQIPGLTSTATAKNKGGRRACSLGKSFKINTSELNG